MSIESRRERRNLRNGFTDFHPSNMDEIKYQQALKRVKRIKGFYIHLIVYIFVNIFIYVMMIPKLHGDYFALRNFSTALCWGIGLLAHGISIFIPGLLMGKDWEGRKINELMEKEKSNKWEQ